MTTTNSSSGHALLRVWRPVAPRTWTIAQISEEFGITHRTVRYYEDVGLVSPERRGTVRVFHPRDRIRLQLVRNKAGLHGISLKGTRPARREGARSAPAARARLTRLAARSLRGGGQPG